MARFDLYATGSDGLLLDVQTNYIAGLETRLVVPVFEAWSVPAPIRRLHPIFAVGGADHLMATHLMLAVPMTLLGQPTDNLLRYYDEIVAALDMIFLGF